MNPLQHRLLMAWSGTRQSLCVVGDPEQTIYSFTGASSSYLQTFRQRHDDAEVVRLVRNYRSTDQVVGLANAVIRRSGGPGALVAQRGSGPEPSWLIAGDEAEEARLVAARIRELIKAGTPASEIAVLVRINAQSEAYEQALADARIPYVLRGGERFFERPEVREAIVLLRGAARAADSEPPQSLAADVRAVLETTGWRSDAPPSGVGAQRERWENVAALVRLAEQAEADSTGAEGEEPVTLAAFVADLAERAAAQHAPTVEGVTLASLHAAKGLEWDAVFLVGLVEGMMPISYATTEAAVAEERRLLYVGITRARQHLTLSWATAREAGRRARKPSRFLTGLAPVAAEPAHRRRPPQARVGAARRGRPGALGGVEELAFGARRGAQATGVLRVHRCDPRGDRCPAAGERGRLRADFRNRVREARKVSASRRRRSVTQLSGNRTPSE